VLSARLWRPAETLEKQVPTKILRHVAARPRRLGISFQRAILPGPGKPVTAVVSADFTGVPRKLLGEQGDELIDLLLRDRLTQTACLVALHLGEYRFDTSFERRQDVAVAGGMNSHSIWNAPASWAKSQPFGVIPASPNNRMAPA